MPDPPSLRLTVVASASLEERLQGRLALGFGAHELDVALYIATPSSKPSFQQRAEYILADIVYFVAPNAVELASLCNFNSDLRLTMDNTESVVIAQCLEEPGPTSSGSFSKLRIVCDATLMPNADVLGAISDCRNRPRTLVDEPKLIKALVQHMVETQYLPFHLGDVLQPFQHARRIVQDFGCLNMSNRLLASYLAYNCRRSALWQRDASGGLVNVLRPYYSDVLKDRPGAVKLWAQFLDRSIDGRNLFDNHCCNVSELAGADLGFVCCLCAVQGWQCQLACGHGYCNECARALDAKWRHQGFARISHCHACRKRLTAEVLQRAEPPTAGGRVLCLDGGGVKCVAAHLVLAALESQTGLQLPISAFFDLVVGTSGGGLTALGLGRNWSASKCQAKLLELASKVFPRRQASFAGRWTGRLGSTLSGLLKYCNAGGLYDRKPLQDTLEQAFGDTVLLRHSDADGPRVAVTTKADNREECALFTSYSKHGHTLDGYQWAQQLVAEPQKVTSVQVANCTSAAPIYFSPYVLQGVLFEDGGLGYNNPYPLACGEARSLFGADENHIVSIGCGEYQRASPGSGRLACCKQIVNLATSTSHVARCAKMVSPDASAQHDRLELEVPLPEIDMTDSCAMVAITPTLQNILDQEALRTHVKQVAWKMVAQSFYCERVGNNFELHNRHGLSTINAHLRERCMDRDTAWWVDVNGTRCQLVKLPIVLSLHYPEANRETNHISLMSGLMIAPISRFPLGRTDYFRYFGADRPTSLGKRKRCPPCDVAPAVGRVKCLTEATTQFETLSPTS